MAANEALNSTAVVPFVPEDTFALRLVMVRKTLELTQQEAAERCGLDDGSWSNWEGGTQPRGMAAVVQRMVDGLGVDRDWLMWGGALRTGRFAYPLTCFDGSAHDGEQLVLVGDDLQPSAAALPAPVLEVVG